MEKQLKEIQENPIQLRDTITAALKEMLKEEAVGDIDSEELMSDNDTAELVDFVIQSLKNHSIKKVGKNNFSFSPYLMGLTMKKYLQGPTAYERFREDAVFVCPSTSNLSKKETQTKYERRR